MHKLKKIIYNNLHRPFYLVTLKFLLVFFFFFYKKYGVFKRIFYKLMLKKENFFNNYFLKNFSYILNIEWDKTKLNSKPYIFVYRYQGFEYAPDIVKIAVKSIEKHSKDYCLILLDKNNFRNYIDISIEVENKLKKSEISMQNFSDYLRIKLLEKYNCLWLDSTILAIKDIPLNYTKLPFFSVKSPNMYEGKREYELYPLFDFGQVYILGGYNKRIYKQVRIFFEDYLSKRSVYLDYFMIYYFFNFLYKYDLQDKQIIEQLPLNNKNIENFFYFRDEKFSDMVIEEDDVFAKLSYKYDVTETLKNKNSLLYNLLKDYIE